MKYFIVLLILISNLSAQSQEHLDALLQRYNENKVPYISPEELAMPKTRAVVLDAREFYEYEISHIKGAMYVGYTEFELDSVTKAIPDKTKPIVVYCSLGIRSETIAYQLKEAGYTDIQNLYGGIFEWKNREFPVYNSEEKETDSVHAFSKSWGKWLTKGIKVYQKNHDDTYKAH